MQDTFRNWRKTHEQCFQWVWCFWSSSHLWNCNTCSFLHVWWNSDTWWNLSLSTFLYNVKFRPTYLDSVWHKLRWVLWPWHKIPRSKPKLVHRAQWALTAWPNQRTSQTTSLFWLTYFGPVFGPVTPHFDLAREEPPLALEADRGYLGLANARDRTYMDRKEKTKGFRTTNINYI